jgi:hypothetical protein
MESWMPCSSRLVASKALVSATATTAHFGSVLSLCRYPNIYIVPPPSNPRQRRRCAQSLFVYAALHLYRWTFASRRHNLGEGVQVVRQNSARDSGISPAPSR